VSSDNPSEKPEAAEGTISERREALIKLGKYTAYAAPVLLVSLSPAQGQPVPRIAAPPPNNSPNPP